MRLRMVCCVFGVLLISAIAVAQSPTFETMLGNFKQAKSDIGEIYTYTLAYAEADPDSFVESIHPRAGGWAVMLAGRQTFVAKPEVEKSIANEFSAGEPTNLLTVYSIAVSKRCGGYDPVTAKLSYGKNDYKKFIGTGNWVTYDDKQEQGKKFIDGLVRLAKNTHPDGRLIRPAIITLVEPDEQMLAEYAHIFAENTRSLSVSRYDVESKSVLLRSPIDPKTVIKMPVVLLNKLASGINFMDLEVVKAIPVKKAE